MSQAVLFELRLLDSMLNVQGGGIEVSCWVFVGTTSTVGGAVVGRLVLVLLLLLLEMQVMSIEWTQHLAYGECISIHQRLAAIVGHSDLLVD